MKIKGVSQKKLEGFARSLGFKLYNVRPEGKFTAFVLRPDAPKGEEYRAFGHYGRKAWAVCWHGHKAFMDKVFAANPSAVLVSTVARYDGREDYLTKLANGPTRPGFESTRNCRGNHEVPRW